MTARSLCLGIIAVYIGFTPMQTSLPRFQLSPRHIEQHAIAFFSAGNPPPSESFTPPPARGLTQGDLATVLIGAGAGALFGMLVDDGDGAARGALIGALCGGVYVVAKRF